MGTNDLCGPKSVTEIADNIIQACQLTLDTCPHIKHIIWCQVTPRTGLDSIFKDLGRYNEDAEKLNRQMIIRISQINRMQHWKHSALMIPNDDIFKDGVHPDSSEEGLEIYMRSIANCCKWAT